MINNEAEYQAKAAELTLKYVKYNHDAPMLFRRWNTDEELRMVVNIIHDTLHEDAERAMKNPEYATMMNNLKKQIPGMTGDDLKFITITAVILGYMGAEA